MCAWLGWGRLGEGGIKGTERERERRREKQHCTTAEEAKQETVGDAGVQQEIHIRVNCRRDN